jgi:signal transduction histidine kinase
MDVESSTDRRVARLSKRVSRAAVGTTPTAMRWTSLIAPTFLFVSLLALALLTSIVHFRSRRLQREIAQVMPAEQLVNNVELALVREMSALHGLALTGNQRFFASYDSARAVEERDLTALVQLAPRFNTELGERIKSLRQLSEQWRRAVPSIDLARRGRSLESAELESDLYDRVIDEANAIQDLITKEVTVRRQAIDTADLDAWRSTLLFAFLAVVTGAVILWLGTRVRRLGEQAEYGRRELERLMEAKGRLMRGLSHDIRNPLGSIVGYAEILEDGLKGELAPAQREYVTRMGRAAGSALAILDDLLTLSQAEAGTLTIHKAPVELALLLHEAVADYRPQVEHAGLELRTHFPAGPLSITTDAARVRQILGNLVSNAIKYTPAPGQVVLSAALKNGQGTPGSGRWLALEVSDTGPGVPADQREKIFEEFYRIDATATTVKGFGVGLAMSRRTARLLDGDVTVASAGERGSTFSLWLPLSESLTQVS